MKLKKSKPIPSTETETHIENARLREENQLLRDLLDYHSIKIPEELNKFLTNERDLGLNGIAGLASEINSLNHAIMILNDMIIKLIMKD